MRVTEQCTAELREQRQHPEPDVPLGTLPANWQGVVSWRASASYVTGAQSMKFGYQGGYLIANGFTYTNTQFLAFRVNNGVPNQITENINAVQANIARAVRRVLRAGTVDARPGDGAGRASVRPRLELFPRDDGRPAAIPADMRSPIRRREGVTSYKDITPRGGVAWDVFGTGKTSLKINAGKYLQAAQTRPDLQRAEPVRTPDAPP